ncbi:MAG: TIGR01212 family radical SAM protein [Peptostreptococcales bacterium]
MSYNKYSDYMKNRYGEKVYKIPLNIHTSCPNRDGLISEGGCIFCGEKGAGFENLPSYMTVSEQLTQNISYIRKKYNAHQFVAYFQNYTNTYLPLEDLLRYAEEAARDDVVELCFSTRPDCISEEYLEGLYGISQKYNKHIAIELGLQTVNYHTLQRLNRGHSLAEVIDAVLRISRWKFSCCLHVILNFPWDNEIDVIENAKIISALPVEQVKLHSLYIVKNTPLCDAYLDKKIELISKDQYVERVILFLRHLREDIVVQRLLGRAPEEETVFCNWNTSWWKIRDEIETRMKEEKIVQGDSCNYLNGSCLKRFHKEQY